MKVSGGVVDYKQIDTGKGCESLFNYTLTCDLPILAETLQNMHELCIDYLQTTSTADEPIALILTTTIAPN